MRMRDFRPTLTCLVAVLALAVGCAGTGSPRVAAPDSRAPTPGDGAKPILILVSFDGFRADYLDRFAAPHLSRIFATGVRADGLTPAFPSKTFPNHWTLVTGLYTEHHGIVANRMVDERTGDRFAMGDPSEFEGKWWGGEPIWLTAQRQGLRAATMFWPGAQVELHGQRPTYWRPYQHELPNVERVAQVMAWLSLPEPERPSVVTLYFSDVDTAGHEHGPFSAETGRAVGVVDAAIGQLEERLVAAGLWERTHLVIVSDHGMSETSPERVIYLDDYVSLSEVDVIEWSPVLGIRRLDGDQESLYRALAGRHPALTIYRRAETPERLHYRNHPHIAPIVGLAADGWSIDRRANEGRIRRAGTGGQHGYDNQLPSMAGIFLARGPRVGTGRVPTVQNVDVYPLLCELAGVSPAPNDGSLARIRGVLK